MNKMPRDLSIIIVNWNTRELLAKCLHSLYKTLMNIDFEIFVVDNASSDKSVEMVRRLYPDVRLIQNAENIGFARANNQAIGLCQGRYVLLLNSDTIIQPGALEGMVRFMDTHPQVGIVGPKLLNEDGTLQRSWAKFPTVWSELIGKNIRSRRHYKTKNGALAYEVDWIGGACFLIRHTAIEKVDLLDERFFMYSEETDFCFRIKQQDWAVCYYPEAQVVHLGGQSSRQASARTKAQLYQSKLLFFQKHYGSCPTRLLGLSLQALFMLKAVIGKLLCLFSLNRSIVGKSLNQDSMELLRTTRQHCKGYVFDTMENDS